MTEPVEIGVFAAAGPGEILGEPLYVQKHDIRSGTQTISVIVPNEPAGGHRSLQSARLGGGG